MNMASCYMHKVRRGRALDDTPAKSRRWAAGDLDQSKAWSGASVTTPPRGRAFQPKAEIGWATRFEGVRCESAGRTAACACANRHGYYMQGGAHG